MENVKFTQLCKSVILIDTMTTHNLVNNGDKVAILGTVEEPITLELTLKPNSNNKLPYVISSGFVPKQHVLTDLNREYSLSKIYENANVEQQHELALDPALSTPMTEKPIVTYMELINHKVKDNVLAILTNFGALIVAKKLLYCRNWEPALYVNEMLKDIFPLGNYDSDFETFAMYKSFIDRYIITALSWDSSKENSHILYTANAAGFLVAFKINETFNSGVKYCHFKTTLGRIVYIKNFGKFLIVSNINGQMQICTINHSETPTITAAPLLWDVKDRVPCKHIIVSKLKESNDYYIVFSKSANIVAFKLSKNGELLNKNVLYIGGFKITAIESLTDNEFIVTTMRCQIIKVKLSFNAGGLTVESSRIKNENDDFKDMQIIGMSASTNKCLWTFLLFRDKEYAPHLKATRQAACLSICKLDSIDPLAKLSKREIKLFNQYLDYLIVIRFNILNSSDTLRYANFFELLNETFSMEINDKLLQSLQIKYFIANCISESQKKSTPNGKQCTCLEIDFLHLAIKSIHIFCRLTYLSRFSRESLTQFQRKAITCMIATFNETMTQIQTLENKNDFLKIAIIAFRKRLETEFIVKFKNLVEDTEILNKDMITTDNIFYRCNVSFTQLPLTTRRFCPNCKTRALNMEDDLKQLFPSDERVKCTFCRIEFSLDTN
ncbi:uncharacterized protein LOC119673137 [Teleopsis dalmanni]|uniref:uncharacterized protein LOC119673137 n=1 Tax=Teleopsis dalmanni TaxID=139649 RepID=UPI0018CE10CF|nr:uncharacterized protein LOC119673137 [Teleopsis dalmanni]